MLKQCSYGVTNAHVLIWAGGYFKAQWHPKQDWSKLLHLPDFNAFSFILHMLVAENCRCMLVQDKIEVQRVCALNTWKEGREGHPSVQKIPVKLSVASHSRDGMHQIKCCSQEPHYTFWVTCLCTFDSHCSFCVSAYQGIYSALPILGSQM